MHIIGHVLPEMVAARNHPKRLLVENVAGFEVAYSHSESLPLLMVASSVFRWEGLKHARFSREHSSPPRIRSA